MLSFWENGYLFYAAAALVLIGAVSKWLASQRYKKLIKQGDALGNAKDKQLKQLKGRYENACRVGGSVPNPEIFVERALSEYRYLWTSLEKLDRVCRKDGIFLILAGALAAAAAYRGGAASETAWRQLFGCAGAAGILFLWDQLLDTKEKRRVLKIELRNYFDNGVGSRLNRLTLPAEREEVPEENPDAVLSEQEQSDVAYLKQSLDRIAASREDASEERELHRLTAEEESVIKEIIKEYLA